jgi:hypothetical protein
MWHTSSSSSRNVPEASAEHKGWGFVRVFLPAVFFLVTWFAAVYALGFVFLLCLHLLQRQPFPFALFFLLEH